MMAIRLNTTMAQRVAAESRRRVEEAVEARRQRMSGYARYDMHRAEMLDGEESDRTFAEDYNAELDRRRETGERTTGWLIDTQVAENRRVREAARRLVRGPGWTVPKDLRASWPMYLNEAITVETEWGAVTVGRSLARMYDLDGWPDADTLKTMAVQQAAGPTLGKGA